MPLKQLYKHNADLEAQVAELYGKKAVSENYKIAENNINTIGTPGARPLSYADTQTAFALASKYGIPIDQAKNRLKANTKANAVAFGGGALDGLLYGILNDKWYSPDWKTEASKNSGKIVGNLLGFLPWGTGVGRLLSAKGGVSPLFKATKALSSYGSTVKAADTVSDAMRYEEVLSSATDALNQAKGAYKATGSAESAALLKKALDTFRLTTKGLVPTANTVSDATRTVGWAEALAGAKAAAQTIRPAQTIKAAYKVGTGIKPVSDLGIGAGKNAPWSDSNIIKELQRISEQENLYGLKNQ